MSYLTKCQLKYESFISQVFSKFDVDGDSLIKFDDLKKLMLDELKMKDISDEDLKEMIKVADLNGDDCVDMDGKLFQE